MEIIKTTYSSYTEAHKKALTKYRANHREKVNSDALSWYHKQMEIKINPDFAEKKREYARLKYHEKKEKDLAKGIVKEGNKVGRPRKYPKITD